MTIPSSSPRHLLAVAASSSSRSSARCCRHDHPTSNQQFLTLERRSCMTCLHTNRIRAPDAPASYDECVCLDCGIVGMTCDRCEQLHPLAPISCYPEVWCHACECCGTCCTDSDKPLTPADIVT